MKFPESGIAHAYLDGLKGIEIGAASHNPFGLDTINVDYVQHGPDTYSGREQIRLAGYAEKVDIIADACALPFEDKSYDFVISSHVIEHIYSPLHALQEMARVARHYVVLIVPHKDRCGEDMLPVTTIEQVLSRYKDYDPGATYADKHWSHWTGESFRPVLERAGLSVIRYDEHDDKVGNGFMYVCAVE